MYRVRHILSWSVPKESEDSAVCVRIQSTSLKQHRLVSLFDVDHCILQYVDVHFAR